MLVTKSAASDIGKPSRKRSLVDLALEAERNDYCVRETALREANNLGGDPRAVVARATAYLAFLRDDED